MAHGREPLYHIAWQQAKVDVSDKGPFAGRMDGVTGEMYEKGQIASTFKADHATADRDSQLLVLTGNVRVDSKKEHAMLSADKVDWHAKDKIVKAFGTIELRGTFGTITGLKEIWATPNLHYFSTPAMFRMP